MKWFRATVLLGLLVVLPAAARGRRKLWELDLSKFANHRTEMSTQVWGIRFSPDETKIAIGFGPRWNFDPRHKHVVVVALDRPQVAIREFDLNTTYLPSADSIAWSPSGSFLVTRDPPAMIRLDTAPGCAFPEDSGFGGFLNGDRMAVAVRHQGEIQIIAPDCSVTDKWNVDPPADILDTSPAKGLIAIERFGKEKPRSTVEVIDAGSHEIKWSWKPDRPLTTFQGGFVFADQGMLACSAKSRPGKLGPGVVCWDARTGSQVAENDRVAVDDHGINGAGGDLLAITDYKYVSHQGRIWVFLDMNDDYSVPQRHLLWNFRTGEEVISWGRFGKFEQTELWGRDPKSTIKIKTPTVISLSPSGKYVAEGGSGSVSVHVIEP